MAKYRRIAPRIWSDEKFRNFSTEEKLIALYALTSQSNRIGLFKFSPAMGAEDLGLTLETFREGFGKVSKALNWRFDEGARVLLIPKWFRYNTPANPNVLKSCLEDLADLPETPLRDEFKSSIEYLPETFHQTFREGLAKPSQQPSPKLPRNRSSSRSRSRKNLKGNGSSKVKSTRKVVGNSGVGGESKQASTSPPTSVSSDTSILEFPTTGRGPETWVLTQEKLNEYAESYPALDVLAECRKARQWCRDNADKRKTAGGMTRFLTAWLNRAQNSNRGKADETTRRGAAPTGPGQRFREPGYGEEGHF